MSRWIFIILLLAAWYIVVFIAARFLSVRVDAALYEISLLALILVCMPLVWLWKRWHRKPGDANELEWLKREAVRLALLVVLILVGFYFLKLSHS